MAGIGPTEMLIILGIVIVIFGAGKLPEVGSALGKGIREFKAETSDEPAAIPQPALAAAPIEAPTAPSTVHMRADEI